MSFNTNSNHGSYFEYNYYDTNRVFVEQTLHKSYVKLYIDFYSTNHNLDPNNKGIIICTQDCRNNFTSWFIHDETIV